MNLAGVPDSIPIDKVKALLRDLGLPLEQITREGITIGWDCIGCTVYATNAEGHRYVDETSDEAAVHHIVIRIDHEAHEQRPFRPAC